MSTVETARETWIKRRNGSRRTRLAVTDGGVTFGADTLVAKMSGPSSTAVQRLAIANHESQILTLLAAAYNAEISEDVLDGFRAADRALAKGDRSLANICLAQIGLPPLPDDDAAYRLHTARALLDQGVAPRTLLKAWGIATNGLDRILLRRLAKYNDCHDKRTGRFTSGPCGSPNAKPIYVVKELDQFWHDKRDAIQGNGQCVTLARSGDPNLPSVATWKPGASLADLPDLRPGTAIATFKDGKYPNADHGNHTAIFKEYAVNEDDGRVVGITVYEQDVNHPTHEKTYLFKKPGTSTPYPATGIDIKDAASYSVVTGNS